MSRPLSPWIRILRGLDELASGVSELMLELPGLEELRQSVRKEVERWELRADSDPAARRVRDLFQALLDVIESPPVQGNSDSRRSRDPKRSARQKRA